MNIAIDCRYIGKSGIGRVLEGILDSIDYSLNHYYLVGDPKYISKLKNAVKYLGELEYQAKAYVITEDKALGLAMGYLISMNTVENGKR